MARLMEPTEEQLTGYREWVASRPEHVRIVAEKFEPWSLYRLKSSGHRVTIVSFGEQEDGGVTLTVCVSGEFNFVMFDRNVFGIKPEDLEPCELPAPNEVTGAMMTPEQVDDNIDALRLMARPDLWVADEDGKAVRRQ